MPVETDLQNAVISLNNAHTSFQTALTTVNAGVSSVNTKAGEAASSASAAAGSATTANAKAGEALSSANAAAGSATSAAGSATTATTKANEASTSATNAGVSATSAATSATAANAAAVSAGAPVLQSLTYGPAVSFDVRNGKYAALTMSGNPRIYISGMKAGEEYRLFLYQDSIGGRTPIFTSRVKWPADVTPTWTTTPNSLTIVRLSCNGVVKFGVIEQVYDGYIPDVATDFRDPNIYNDMPAWLDYSGITGNRMYFDSNGKLTWAPHNLLLNSATLATQTVAVTVGATNILSFSGTGSVALSGAATGTLAGTGSNNRVFLIITPTTTSLTLTVTGSVTQAQLERVTYQTTPRPWISTGAAAVYMPRFGYDPNTLLPIGLIWEESRTNLITYSQQFDDASWTKVATTVSANVSASPDGTTSADKVSGDGNLLGHIVRKSVTVSPNTTYTLSVRGKAAEVNFGYITLGGTGGGAYSTFNYSTGAVGSLQSGIISRNITPVGNGFYQASITFTTGSSVGSNFIEFSVAPTDTIAATTASGGIFYWGSQLELGSEVTSYIPTVASTVTRAADILKATGNAKTILCANAGSAIMQVRVNSIASFNNFLGDANRVLLWADVNTTLKSTSQTPSPATLSATIGGSGTWTGGAVRAGIAWNASGRSIVANNGTVVSDSNTIGTATDVPILSVGNGVIESAAFWTPKLPDATLKSKSIVEASF